MSAEFDKFMQTFREDVWRVKNEIAKEWSSAVNAIKGLNQQLSISTTPKVEYNVPIHVGERQAETVMVKEPITEEKTLKKKQVKRCRRCGKELLNDISKERGYGPQCYKKQLKEAYKHPTLFDISALKKKGDNQDDGQHIHRDVD